MRITTVLELSPEINQIGVSEYLLRANVYRVLGYFKHLRVFRVLDKAKLEISSEDFICIAWLCIGPQVYPCSLARVIF